MTVHLYVLSVSFGSGIGKSVPFATGLLGYFRVFIFISTLFSILYRLFSRSVDFQSQIFYIHPEFVLKRQKTFLRGTKNI